MATTKIILEDKFLSEDADEIRGRVRMLLVKLIREKEESWVAEIKKTPKDGGEGEGEGV